MQKLKLSLDDLKVESFRTVWDENAHGGTVRGNVFGEPDEAEPGVIIDTDAITIAKSCYATNCGASCNNNSCNASCNGSCATCHGTCHDPTCFPSSPRICC